MGGVYGRFGGVLGGENAPLHMVLVRVMISKKKLGHVAAFDGAKFWVSFVFL